MRSLPWAVALLPALLVLGCPAPVIPKDAVYACDQGGCPSGSVCRDGFCFPVDAQGGGAGGGATGGGSGGATGSGAGGATGGGTGGAAGGGDAGCVVTSCTVEGKNCGTISDGCGGTLSCGSCAVPQTCGGGTQANVCGCTPTPKATVCARANASCGPLVQPDGCGATATFDCGSCSPGNSCQTTGNATSCQPCVSESDVDFCDRHGANCGVLTAADNCGLTRTNVNCGACSLSSGCGGGGVPNLCACRTILQRCAASNQCCTGAACGHAGLCCVAGGGACTDDPQCCQGSCALGFCAGPDGGL